MIWLIVKKSFYGAQFYYPILQDIDLPLNPTKVHYSITQVNVYVYRKFPYHSSYVSQYFLFIKFIECSKSINVYEHFKE